MGAARGPMGALAGACAALFVVTAATPATAGIRVVEDEVIFTLEAPGAKRVFLVGDFNNWNPTVERMPHKEGDVFEVQLFLVEGEYRYKFVVDGNWIVDPDNPGGDPQRGSPFTLIETPGGMALRTEEPVAESAPPPLSPSVRYIVTVTSDRDDSDVEHIVDLNARVKRGKLESAFVLQTRDDSWDTEPAWFELAVRRGFIATRLGPVAVRAFESDSVWTSHDPFGLVGDAGLYEYNAGYGRTGGAVDYGLSESIHLRALVADRSGDVPAPPGLDPSAVSAFAAGGGADTTLYRFDRSAAGGDVYAVEAFVDGPDFRAGYVRRNNVGVHAGVLARVERRDSTVTATLFDTRESWACDVYWLRLKKLFGFAARGGYGRGRADVMKLHRDEVNPMVTLRPTAAAVEFDDDETLLESDRFAIDLERRFGPVRVSASWDRVRFDFDEAVGSGGDATVDRAGARAATSWGRWRAGGAAVYTRADYGETPVLVDDPARNFWLDERDNFTVANIVGIDEGDCTTATAFVELARDSLAAPPAWAPSRAHIGAEAVVAGGGVQYVAAAAGLERDLPRRFFVAVDGRWARYDKPAWGAAEAFVSGYVEGGYRRPHVDITLGFGLDPVVFDPIVNDYAEIGRSEFLRGALADDLTREQSDAIGARLLRLEKELESFSVIKLECIVRF